MTTPELIETAARALAVRDANDRCPNVWAELRNDERAHYIGMAEAIIPLIDRSARADELRKQAARLRLGATMFAPDLPDDSAAAGIVSTLIDTADEFQVRAALLSAPTEEPARPERLREGEHCDDCPGNCVERGQIPCWVYEITPATTEENPRG